MKLTLACCVTICLTVSSVSFAQKNDKDKGVAEKCPHPIFKSTEVTRKVKIKHTDDPDYTKEARKRDITGRVVLRAVLCANGKVTNIEVIKSLPYGLTAKAIETMPKMRFRPAEKDGHPVSVAILREFSFGENPAIVQAQEKQQPSQPRMVEFHMALMKRGPKWSAGLTNDKLHASYLLSILSSGKAVIAGPLGDDADIVSVYIMRAQSGEEAKSWAEQDPAVKDGRLIVEMHPWWSEEVMKKPDSPIKFTTAYLGLLMRGAKWTPEKTPATEELQRAHMANINRLAETKKLVVAGPFGDNGTLRGIFVFRVASLEEAKELAETDPAVKAGRLAIEMHPWLVPEGVLP